MLRNYQHYIFLLFGIAIVPPINSSLYHQLASSPYKSLQLFDHVIQHPIITTTTGNFKSIPFQNFNNIVYPTTLNQIKFIDNNNLPINFLNDINNQNQYGSTFDYNSFAVPTTSSSPLPASSVPTTSLHFQNFALQPQINELSYIINGRILKQYLVMEESTDDSLQTTNTAFDHLNRILNNPFNKNSFVPFLPTNINSRIPTAQQQQQQQQNINQNLGFATQQSNNNNNNGGNQVQSTPLSLGSGSLGYIRLPNGAVYLGSGSLGYIDPQQRVNDIINRKQQSANNNNNNNINAAGPLSFGQQSS